MLAGGTTIVKGRWKLVKKIGQGAFGEIYSGVDMSTSEPVAIKFERWDSKRAVLKLEVAVLKKLQATSSQYVARYIHCGHWEDYNFLVMELLGENLAEIRRKRVAGRFSLGTVLRLGCQMIRAIEGIHNLGYLHRDIKPSNFAMGLHRERSEHCIMIDFGLTRKFRFPNGNIREARGVAGFRGTARYASINSHLSKELSRRDDMWSLLYMLIEFYTGSLPWKRLKDREEIGLLKMKNNSTELVRQLPVEFQIFMEHLQKLEYADAPDYDMLYTLFERLAESSSSRNTLMVPYDWEEGTRPMSIPGDNGLSLDRLAVNLRGDASADREHSARPVSETDDMPKDFSSHLEDTSAMKGSLGAGDNSLVHMIPRGGRVSNVRPLQALHAMDSPQWQAPNRSSAPEPSTSAEEANPPAPSSKTPRASSSPERVSNVPPVSSTPEPAPAAATPSKQHEAPSPQATQPTPQPLATQQPQPQHAAAAAAAAAVAEAKPKGPPPPTAAAPPRDDQSCNCTCAVM